MTDDTPIDNLVAADLTPAVRADAIKMLSEWKHPEVNAWPEGSKSSRGCGHAYRTWRAAEHHLVETPSGDIFIHYPESRSIQQPYLLWSYEVCRDGSVEAFPRIANTHFMPAGGDKDRNSAMAVGLERRYVVGKLRAPTVEMLPTAIVRDGVHGTGEYVSIEPLYGYPDERDALRAKLCP